MSKCVDLRPFLLPVQDQGERGTCLALSVTAAHEIMRASNVSPVEDFSEEMLYWVCKQIDQDFEPGTTFDSASSALAGFGQPLEAVWPYDRERDDSNDLYMPPQVALDAKNNYKAHVRQITSTVSEIKRWLIKGHPVVLGMKMWAGFYMTTAGHISMPSPTEIIEEGHAVLAVGFDESDSLNEPYIILRNSWGTDWGEDGYGYLPYSFIEMYHVEAWVVMLDRTGAT